MRFKLLCLTGAIALGAIAPAMAQDTNVEMRFSH